ncbi:MAG: hypothetical protein H7A04_18070 [Pseudomonadales bacterium]|nr:hypothetical protein [Pseudomonadales bacterium]MCP5348762.1 hypothetical protein [Pseudomonadales bacterium]
MGRLFTGSPPITQLQGPYLLAQLRDFAGDRRSVSEPGKHQATMMAVAKRFNSTQLVDITAYLKTLDN